VRERRVELLATILLAAAALATAWSTYQSGQWRGDQAADSTKGTAARIESSEAFTRAGQLTQIDVALFVQWLDANARGDRKLAGFYRRRFRDEFEPAFAAWLASKPLTSATAPPSPFAMPHYRLAQVRKATQLDAQAAAHSADANDANDRADSYLLAVVLFASALFFAGISTKLSSRRQREVLLAFGWAIFLGAAIWVATVPVRLPV
jgi:hypothetical protein